MKKNIKHYVREIDNLVNGLSKCDLNRYEFKELKKQKAFYLSMKGKYGVK